MKVRVKSGKHYRNEDGQTVRYVEGEVFNATEVELQAFKDRLEVVTEPASIVSEEVSAEKPVKQGETAATIDSGERKAGKQGNSPAGQLTEAPGEGLRAVLTEKVAAALEKAGIHSLEDLGKIASDPDELAKIPGIGGKTGAKKLREALIEAKVPVRWMGGPIEPGTPIILGNGDPETFIEPPKTES